MNTEINEMLGSHPEPGIEVYVKHEYEKWTITDHGLQIVLAITTKNSSSSLIFMPQLRILSILTLQSDIRLSVETRVSCIFL